MLLLVVPLPSRCLTTKNETHPGIIPMRKAVFASRADSLITAFQQLPLTARLGLVLALIILGLLAYGLGLYSVPGSLSPLPGEGPAVLAYTS